MMWWQGAVKSLRSTHDDAQRKPEEGNSQRLSQNVKKASSHPPLRKLSLHLIGLYYDSAEGCPWLCMEHTHGADQRDTGSPLAPSPGAALN